jgi:hypothetical protein
VEELLKPRIKVIASMPIMKNKVGDYLRRYEYAGGDFDFGIKTVDAEHFYSLEEFNEWPYIFKILEWWEDRSKDEMPEYVKTIYDGNVNKVIKYDFETDTIFMQDPQRPYQFSLKAYLSARLPATEAEYNESINSQK